MGHEPLTAPERGPGIWFPPPLLYAIPFFGGWLLGRGVPLAITRGEPVWLERVGVGLVAVWAALFVWAAATLVRAGATIRPDRPAKALVTTGPYAVSRNPLYLGLTVLYAGLALMVNSVWPVFLLPIPVLLIDRVVIPREERYLEATFGERYEEYRRRVRRWL
ncbi:MAG: methyltransferase family protein [Gemmatimonadales bacterium]